MNDLKDRIKNVMSATLEIPVSDVNEDTSSETLVNWDSLKHMNLIIALEEEFSVKLSIDQIIEMKSFPAICAEIKLTLS